MRWLVNAASRAHQTDPTHQTARLGTAADTGFPCAIWFERDPLLESIRQQPIFATVMERVRAQRQSALSLDALGR